MGWGEGLLAEQCPPWALRYSCHAQPSHPLCHQEEGNTSPELMAPQAPVPSLAPAGRAQGCSDSCHVGGSSGPSTG